MRHARLGCDRLRELRVSSEPDSLPLPLAASCGSRMEKAPVDRTTAHPALWPGCARPCAGERHCHTSLSEHERPTSVCTRACMPRSWRRPGPCRQFRAICFGAWSCLGSRWHAARRGRCVAGGPLPSSTARLASRWVRRVPRRTDPRGVRVGHVAGGEQSALRRRRRAVGCRFADGQRAEGDADAGEDLWRTRRSAARRDGIADLCWQRAPSAVGAAAVLRLSSVGVHSSQLGMVVSQVDPASSPLILRTHRFR